MVITPSFQVGDGGSIPLYRSMSYIDDYKVVWLMPQRACTRSSVELLRHSSNFVNRGHDLTVPDEKKDFTLIFNIRNPLPRIVSIYWLWGLQNKNFERNFTEWLYDYKEWETKFQLHLEQYISKLHKRPDYYVRTEYFHEDLMKINPMRNFFLSLGEDYDWSVHNNKYKEEFNGKTDKIRFPWYNEYNQKNANFVYELCKPQFELFGYNPNYWKDGNP
jgi:hypothetical protein